MSDGGRCECTVGPHRPQPSGVFGGYRQGQPDPFSGPRLCKRRATKTACGLFVCAQHARYLTHRMALICRACGKRWRDGEDPGPCPHEARHGNHETYIWTPPHRREGNEE